MRITGFLVLLAALAFGSKAFAEPVTIASAAQGSSTYNMALAISDAVSAPDGIDMRPQPYKSTSQASGFVDTGEVNFGLENSIAIRQAMLGEGKFEGKALKNLRLVARLLPLRMTLAVRKDSGINKLSDLKGKRLPAGFSAAVTGETLIGTMLASGGLSYDDVEKVQISDFTAMAEAFVAGQIDAFIHVIGTPRDVQVSKDVGGITTLQLGSDDAAKAYVAKNFPVGSLYLLQPDAKITTINEPTTILQYDYYIYSHAGQPDESVRALLDGIRKNKAQMVEAVSSMSWFDPDKMYADIGLAWHPAAEAFFKETGQMP